MNQPMTSKEKEINKKKKREGENVIMVTSDFYWTSQWPIEMAKVFRGHWA